MKRFMFTLVLLLLFCSQANSQPLKGQSNQPTIGAKAPFSRIISLYGAHTENLFSLGLDTEIIGVSTSEDFPLAAKTKPSFNARDGVEKFLKAKPDLILIRPMLQQGHPALWAALKKHGITVVSLQPNTIDQMFTYWRTLGRLTGHEMQAEYMVEDFQDGISRAEQRLASLSDDRLPGVFFESIHSKHATFSPGAMPLFVLKEAGGLNIADDAKPRHGTNIADYGLERLLSKGNRIDVYLAQYGPMNKVTTADIKNSPAASRIKAVLNRNVFLVDEHLVSRPTMRLLQGIEVVYQLLHP